jgi:hypothetical protein
MNELIAGDEIWVHHVIPEAASGRSWFGGGGGRQTHIRDGDLISLHFSFRKKNRLKTDPKTLKSTSPLQPQNITIKNNTSPMNGGKKLWQPPLGCMRHPIGGLLPKGWKTMQPHVPYLWTPPIPR